MYCCVGLNFVYLSLLKKTNSEDELSKNYVCLLEAALSVTQFTSWSQSEALCVQAKWLTCDRVCW